MGTCKYCNKDAGFFSHVHKECEEKHEQGIKSLEDGIRRYFKDKMNMNELAALVTKLKGENYPERKYLRDFFTFALLHFCRLDFKVFRKP